jgi:SAM-dependent methyltransferase
VEPDERAVRARAFGGVADAYERARPGYPPEAVAWLAGEPPRDVVDLGAGTGKLTRGLADAGHRVVAVDPAEEMLAHLRAAVPGVRVLRGTGEAIPLPDGSADVVTVAQAFHWFDHQPALREIARVLRPAGVLGLVWNARDEREAWVARLSALIGTERLDDDEIETQLFASRLFGPVERARFEHVQRLDRETILDLVASRSYCATRPPDERARILEAAGRVFDDAAVGGEAVLPYVTETYRAVRR